MSRCLSCINSISLSQCLGPICSSPSERFVQILAPSDGSSRCLLLVISVPYVSVVAVFSVLCLCVQLFYPNVANPAETNYPAYPAADPLLYLEGLTAAGRLDAGLDAGLDTGLDASGGLDGALIDAATGELVLVPAAANTATATANTALAAAAAATAAETRHQQLQQQQRQDEDDDENVDSLLGNYSIFCTSCHYHFKLWILIIEPC